MPLPITIPRLLAVMPRSGGVVASFAGPMNAAMIRWKVGENDMRIAAFLAQAAHESGELLSLEENLNYRAERLLEVWPRRFTVAEATAYSRLPERIANRVYANRLGNGDEASGDGWRFRGRGIFQLTGRDNYRDASLAICGGDTLLENPDLVTEPTYACESAGWFWCSRDLDRFADVGDFVGLTRAINGGLNGLQERTAYWRRAVAALA